MRGATCSIKLKSARNQRWQKFSNRLSSWDMGPQYLDSARQNASIYLPSLSSNSTICWSTHGKTCELVSRTRERSRLRPKNPETPKNSASVLKNMVTYPPPTHTFLKWPFPTDFKKYTHTPPPPGDDMFAHRSKSRRNCRKVPKPTKLAGSECPREICLDTHFCWHRFNSHCIRTGILLHFF